MTTLGDSTYGSDKAGLVCAYAFASGESVRLIDSDEAIRLAGATATPRPFLWLHFSLSNSASERWLLEHLTLPPAFYELLKESPSTRLEAVGDSLVAVVHDLQFFGAEAGAAATVTLCVDQHMMVSARTTQLRAVDRLRTAVKSGATFDSPVELLAHLLRDQADVLVEIVRDATKQLDLIEDTFLEEVLPRSRSRLGRLRRRLVRLQRLLAPEPAALFRLLSRPPSWLTDTDVADLQRSAEELAAAVADSGAVIDRVRILQDELSARLNEETSRTLYILTVLTAITAPFAFISGLFGMNVAGIPFQTHPHGFLIVFVVILAVIALGAALVRRIMRRL